MLLNRRGWSNFLTCRTCGKVWMCPQCDVALVLHRAEGAVACHHCGHRERVPERCDACGSPSVARHGAGTERLETELAEALDVPVFRLDADAAGAKDAVPALLARFEAAPTGLLVGTQMVAKGHDFPDVTLGVVRRRRRDAALPRLPRRGADVRAGRAARRPRRARAAGRARARADDARRTRRRSRRRAPRRATASSPGELERRERSLPAVRDLIRVVCSARRGRGRPRAAAGAIADAVGERARARPCSARRRCSACAAASAPRSSSRRPTAPRRSRPCAVAVDRAANARERRDVAFSVDVDPQ